MGTDDLLRQYLPPEFAARLRPVDGGWRGRTALLLWALGYPLEMAWWLAMTDDPIQSRRYRTAIDRLDDGRLRSLLRATTKARGDGLHLGFVSLGIGGN